MIVKVGDGLGETFGNIVGRLAATLAVLTPVIPAFHASVLVVHPVLPDRDHAAMLTMVKDGSWFRFVHRHPSSMGFYRAMPGADTLKQDELRAAAGQRSERLGRARGSECLGRARGSECLAGWGSVPTMAAVSRPLTKVVVLVPFGGRRADRRRR